MNQKVAADTTPLNVLLVEDSPTEAKLAEHMLSGRQGLWAVRTVGRLSDAFVELRTRPVDVVLLDLNLPDSKGLDTVAAVRGHSPEIAVVVLTAYDDEATSLEILRRGAQDYLLKKGWGSAQLSRVLRHAIERQRTALALRDSLERFPPAFRESPLGVVHLDNDLKLVEANDAFARALGRARDQLLAAPVATFLHPEEQDRELIALARLLRGEGSSHRSEPRWLAGDGSGVPARITAWRVRGRQPLALVVSDFSDSA
jgi:PAS domain S-box-containing protein